MKSASKSLYSQRAVFAAMGLALAAGFTPAGAADLGGNCCADLEERIAELEATTARKGNRKVKLEVSGHVNEAMIFWDDGFESNAGIYTNDNSRTRFRFKGSAKIADDWKAGYMIEIGVRGASSKRFTQDDVAARADSGLDVRHSYWYIEGKKYGTVSVGHTGPAAESITEINLAQTKDVAKFSDVEDSGLGIGVRFKNGVIGTRDNTTQDIFGYRRVIAHSGDQPGEVERGLIVKYDTPAFAGFTATAAWGGDDYWDVGLRYAGEFGGFKIAGGIAYGQETSSEANAGIIDDCLAVSAANNPDADCKQLGGSLSIMHSETGLYVTGAAGYRKDDNIDDLFDAPSRADDTSTFYAIEAGIEKKFFDLGKTTIFGQYYDFQGGSNDRTDLSFDNNVTDFNIANSDLTMWGGGIVQGIDAAAMSLYVYYRRIEADVTLVNGAGADIAHPGIEDLDLVVAGGMIKF